MERRVKILEDFVHKEENGQKWRRITPILGVSQLFASLGGFAMLAWFAIYIIGNFDKQLDIMRTESSRKDVQIQDINGRIACLNGNERSCCKESQNC